jgi:hypothetical protein
VRCVFSTCLFCKADLGRNAVLETFPVGRRLAFDAVRGRLWVVCRICARWNLSPLEERWEATERCEREFRELRRRVTTENIGFGQMPEGLELIRVGAPLRDEFAAWRYGGELNRRWRRHRVARGVRHVANWGLLIAGNVALWAPVAAYDAYAKDRIVGRVDDGRGGLVPVKRRHVGAMRLLPEAEAEGGWVARIKHAEGTTQLMGDEAVRVVGRLLPLINEHGANEAQVAEAVRQLERAGDLQRCFTTVAAHLREWQHHGLFRRPDHRVETAPLELRLALEMAAHEESERRALEGELVQLEREWREAEEIAAIADDLLLPRAVTERLALWRARPGSTHHPG